MSICHLAELDNDMLYLYGPGSLDALDRNWGNQAVQAVTAISFKFIDFDLIVPQLHKIRARFPSLVVSILGLFDRNFFLCGTNIRLSAGNKRLNTLVTHMKTKVSQRPPSQIFSLREPPIPFLCK